MFEPHLKQVLASLARLFRYPTAETCSAVERLYVVLQHEIPLAAKEIARFGEQTERLSIEQFEETYTKTFEINSKCAPEIGWHLFGEEFTRGMLLVRMREELARYGIPETTELPDHISHALLLVAQMPRAEADRFVPACIFPALLKMRQSAERMGSPYLHVIGCLEEILRHEWGPLLTEQDDEPVEGFPVGVDPLHAFPVLDIEGEGCAGCSEAEPSVIDPRVLTENQGNDDQDIGLGDEIMLPTNPRLYEDVEEEN